MSTSEERRDERLLITHLTRMNEGFLCIAGQTRAGEQIRPLRGGGDDRWSRSWLHPNGPLRIGHVIQIQRLIKKHHSTRHEDWITADTSRVESVRRLSADHFWEQLEAWKAMDLQEAFSGTLEKTKRNSLFVRPPTKKSTLATIELRNPVLERSYPSRPAIRFKDPVLGSVKGRLTDIRAFTPKNEPDGRVLDLITRRFKDGTRVLGCIGLTHPWAPASSTDPPCHWLQVNNLHFEGDLDLSPEG